jgi:membrane protein YqaA with SNARE-associated domain
MSEYSSLLGTLLGAIVGGFLGFGGAYLIERQRFRKEDEEKLYEKVYGERARIVMPVSLNMRTV